MKILEVTMLLPGLTDHQDMWAAILEIPETINDLSSFLKEAKKDFPKRKVRIIEVLEQ